MGIKISWEKVEWYWHFIAVAIFLIIFLGGFSIGVFYEGQEIKDKNNTQINTGKDQLPDFDKVGNIIIRNKIPKFLYEEPGAPALSLNLKFNDKSICSPDGQKQIECNQIQFKNGERAKIIGFKDNENLEVLYIDLLKTN